MKFFLENFILHKEKTDCIIVGIFQSRELTSSADKLDTYSNGYIRELVNQGDIDGKIGQSLLLYNVPLQIKS